MSNQDMVERVARAIGQSEPPEHYLVSWQAYVPAARAAIAAMREPTEAMSRAAKLGYGEDYWPAMIDAALAEKP